MELIYTIRYEKDEFGRIDVPSAIFSLSDDVYEHCDFLCEEYRKRVELDAKIKRFIRASKNLSYIIETDMDIYKYTTMYKSVFYCERAFRLQFVESWLSDLLNVSDYIKIIDARAEFTLNTEL
ncbi:MAG: hypothetical protein MJ177_01540 [Clostridia bacterium]|nr:hypothetical protein [Clostridia bacterium]